MIYTLLVFQNDFAERRFFLATDLDGTFLGGTRDDRLELYRTIERNRADIGLIFVTGRDPRFIAGLCDGSEVPWPDFVVGDVGTTIARIEATALAEDRIQPIAPLEADIAERWNDMGAKVREALDGHPGLTLQPTRFRYRVSYDLDAGAYDGRAAQKVEELGLDHLISDNRYFDVLPRGVSKGPSLKRLIAHLGVEESRVLAAGDTMNDYSMLACGLPAVAVGGSEAPLLEKLQSFSGVHKARGIGAAGILEAIATFNLFPLSQGERHAV